MATATTLIQSKEVVNQGILKGTPLNARFDASQLSAWLSIAEQRFLLEPKSFVCDEFYNALVAAKNPVPSNYNASLGPLVDAFLNNTFYETLWKQHLLQYLSLAVYVVSLPQIAIQTGSNGLFQNNTEFSTNVGVAGLKFMQDTQMQNLDDLKVRMIKFLCDNQANYPLFCTTGLCKDDCPSDDLEGRDLGFVFLD